jgi:ABC-type molybdate transport system permease subunit
MATGTTAPTTTNTLPLKIMSIVNAPDNASAAAYQRLHVMINQHYYMGGQTAT